MNLIDTPGHVDFTIEATGDHFFTSLLWPSDFLFQSIPIVKTVDSDRVPVDGLRGGGGAGVQSQTITVDRQMKRYEVPRVVFINKLDRYGSDPFLVLGQIRKKLGLTIQPVQLPIGEEDNFRGVVTLPSLGVSVTVV
eukprot:Skav230166  [mRNA]  locus=scaffold996:165120:167083:- [translate_table: standard]